MILDIRLNVVECRQNVNVPSYVDGAISIKYEKGWNVRNYTLAPCIGNMFKTHEAHRDGSASRQVSTATRHGAETVAVSPSQNMQESAEHDGPRVRPASLP